MGPFFWGVTVGSVFTAILASIVIFVLPDDEDRWKSSILVAWAVAGIFFLLALGITAASTGGNYQYIPNTPTPLLGR